MQRFAVIGLGRFGQHLARALTQAGAEVIGIDSNVDVVERMRDEVALAVRLDGTDVAALKSQGVAEVDAAIVGIGEDFESAALSVAALKEMGVEHIVARAMTETQGTILRAVGADEIAFAERESALRWGHRLSMPRLEHYMDLGEDHSLIYMAAPAAFCGKTLQELGLRKKYGVNLVALRRTDITESKLGRKTRTLRIIVPQPDTKIREDDVLVLIGSNESLSALPVD
ncbi:MAG: TrkA family potassium uptake protein [Phycisphaerales bacterium]|nr:TrkA family potassium uptake protein [Phycisphaerales bacterium]